MITDLLRFVALALAVSGALVGTLRVIGAVRAVGATRDEVITSDRRLSDDEVARMRAEWDALMRGTNEQRRPLTPDGPD